MHVHVRLVAISSVLNWCNCSESTFPRSSSSAEICTDILVIMWCIFSLIDAFI